MNIRTALGDCYCIGAEPKPFLELGGPFGGCTSNKGPCLGSSTRGSSLNPLVAVSTDVGPSRLRHLSRSRSGSHVFG